MAHRSGKTSAKSMVAGTVLAIVALILTTPLAALSILLANRLSRWWALTSDERTVKRIHKLKRQLVELRTIRLYQLLIPLGGFILLVVNAFTLMVSTTYLALFVDLHHSLGDSRFPNMSASYLRAIRLLPLIVGAGANLYATWLVRRYAQRLPAYRMRIEREMETLQLSLSPNLHGSDPNPFSE